MRAWKSILAGAAMTAAALTAASPGVAQDQSVEDLYSGNTLTILIGHPPGGSYDLYAQLAAAHFGQFLPGEPNVIVQHMPGGGGRRAAAYFHNNTEPDGLTVAILPDTLAHIQLLTPEQADWDAAKFRYIGRFAPANSAFAIGPTAPIDSAEEMKDTQVVVACTGKAARSAQMPALLKNLLGYDLRLICGYKGSAASKLATIRGEVDMFSQNWASFAANDQADMDSGDLRIIMQAGLERDPDIPEVPLLQELTDDEEAQRILRFASSAAPIGRPMMAVPGTPENVIAALREAFQEMVTDPAFLEDAERRGAIIIPATGEEVETINEEIVSASPELIEATRSAMDASDAEETQNPGEGSGD
ncbi:Bug family tripartite tricarboxylate transporter substrate binding protein [Lutibaculum baratangense]|uniref:Uncharacterized protein UPF0065 n=1 Tax=Lutibaculum baratangense AMV1 TaxID=631454 RepID=V4TJR5_9HYPH|nr:tripartite tricarboxylate transporter substrate-binding protein [Lutibaculum baratangense]ESR26148.1 uncharacterized protein UPF0065 [Lutibaculum baratangense AMV1]